MTSIPTLLCDCIAAFDHAIAHFNDPETLGLQVQFKDERGRLNVWASNVGARQDSSSSASLDYRLRQAPLMRAGIIRGLERVKRLITRSRYSVELPKSQEEAAAKDSLFTSLRNNEWRCPESMSLFAYS
jgi:hypothetical protein